MDLGPASTPATPARPAAGPADRSPLAPARVEFARLLGRLLADRWDRLRPPAGYAGDGPAT